MAIGSITGALLSARRAKPKVVYLLAGVTAFGCGCTLAAIMPNYWLFGLALIMIGMSAQTFTTTANSTVQLKTERHMRGRVMAIYVAVLMGGTPIGAPIVGWIADKFGARWALGVGAFAGFSAAIVGIRYLVKHRNLRLRLEGWQLRVSMDSESAPDTEHMSENSTEKIQES
jgi:MFS family permease